MKPATPTTPLKMGGPELKDLLKTEAYQHPPLEAMLPPDPEAPRPHNELQLSLFPTEDQQVEQVLELMESLDFSEAQLAKLLFHIPLADTEGIINKRLAFEFAQLPETFVQQLQIFAQLVVNYARLK